MLAVPWRGLPGDVSKGNTMRFEDLTPELQEKAKSCSTPEEMFALAKEEGMELTDEELEAVSGGDSPFVWDCDAYSCASDCAVDYR